LRHSGCASSSTRSAKHRWCWHHLRGRRAVRRERKGQKEARGEATENDRSASFPRVRETRRETLRELKIKKKGRKVSVFVPTQTHPRIRDFHSSVCLRCVSGLG
jgi:hypothetical protein